MSEIYLNGLCKYKSQDWTLWSTKIGWDTPDPDITLCFQYTILNWVPLFFLWISCSIYIPIILGRVNLKHTKKGKFNIFKSTLIAFLVLIHILNFCKTIADGVNKLSPPPAMYLQPVLSIISSTLLIYLNRLIFMKGIHTSGILFFYWLLQFLANLIIIYSRLRRVKMEGPDIFRTVTSVLEFVLVLVSFLCNCFADQAVFADSNTPVVDQGCDESQSLLNRQVYDESIVNDPNISPESKASFLSKKTYVWITELIIKGYRKTLTFNDLYKLHDKNSCGKIIPKMEKEWNEEIEKAKNYKTKKPAGSDQFKINYQNLKNKDFSKNIYCLQEKNMVTPSLFNALFHTVGYPFVASWILRLIYDLLSFVQPILLGFLIKFIENRNDFSWHGYLFSICTFIIGFLQNIIIQDYFFMAHKTGMRARTAIIGIVYRKMLKLSPASKNEAEVGEIINHMSVDSQKIQEVFIYINYLWTVPLTIIIGIGFLWRLLGPSVLAGFVLLISLIPLIIIIAMKIKNLQKEQMKIKDDRMKLIADILNGMKILKLYAWERLFEKIIRRKRNEECRLIRTAGYLYVVIDTLWFFAPFLMTLCTFSAYMVSNPNNILTVHKAFISLTIFNIINNNLCVLPETINCVIQAKISLQRINKFLLFDELDQRNIENLSEENSLTIINGTFSWKRDEKPVLTDINIDIQQGSLIAIVGVVGSGKTSLASALIGEMFKLSGQIKCQGTLAYVPQEAWCLNASVKDNILFNKPINVQKYDKVIKGCALLEDLKVFPSGDETEIGERGINLSGGQKQRISLARAIYHDSSIYIFDDPFSAVDSNVGKHIFDQVIGKNGLLSNKTRILITHGVTYLPKVDKIYVMEEGQVRESGTFLELLNKNGSFAEMIRTHFKQEDENVENSTFEELSTFPQLSKQSCTQSRMNNKVNIIQDEMKNNFLQNNKTIKEEYMEIDSVKYNVYLSYIRSGTYLFASIVLVSFVLYMVFFVGTNVFLSKWTESQNSNISRRNTSINFFLKVYGGLGAGQILLIIIQNIVLAHTTFLTSKSLHRNMLKSLFRAPNLFFDITPAGRILNRVGNDIDIVDIRISSLIKVCLKSLANVMGPIVVIIISSPYFLIGLIPLIFAFIMIQKFYMQTSRQLIRIDAITRSPIYSSFKESLAGVSSIRAYKVENEFIDKCDALIDDNQKAWYLNILLLRWPAIYFEYIGNIVILLTSIIAVLTRSTIGTGFAGLSISLSLYISWSLSVMVRCAGILEINFVAVERILEYIKIKPEAPWIINETKPDSRWPDRGEIKFINYSVKYRPELDFVLKDLSFVVNAREKLAIVGRTGAGKSSLALGLLRLIEPEEGSILIDDIDISKLGLYDLRSKITIIPQDPVIFCGTLRMNLDPFTDYSDGELWAVLDMVHLKSFLSKSADGLDFVISENSENLSVGQKQLICLARALLKRTKILVLDEATAAIDIETDELIQKSIRDQFQNCTVLTIAHRINTIMDYDRVMVLHQGKMCELDTPKNLLSNNTSIFFSMVRDAGLI